MTFWKRKQIESVHPVLDAQVSIGEMPSTTLRECRMHADSIAERNYRSPTEQGLAITVMYLIDRLEKESNLNEPSA